MSKHTKRKVTTGLGVITFDRSDEDTQPTYQAQIGEQVLSIYRTYSWDPKPPKKKPSGFAVYISVGKDLPVEAPFIFVKSLQEAAELGHAQIMGVHPLEAVGAR